MRILNVFLAILLLAGLCAAADVSGKWIASMPGRDGGTREVPFTFKAEGSTLTGTVGGMQGREQPISDGKIDGDNISFKVKMEFQGNAMVMLYKGVVSGDEIKFTQTREGADRTSEFTAKRAK